MAAIVLAATVAVSAVLRSEKGERRAGVYAVEMRKTKRVGNHEGEKGKEEERSAERGRERERRRREHVRKDGSGEGTTGYGGKGWRRNDRRKEWSTA